MKKLLGIVVLGLLLSGNAYAKCIKGNCINGYGILKFITNLKTNAQYDGEFSNGKWNGKGTLTDIDEDFIWEGEWKNNGLVKQIILAKYLEPKTKDNIIIIPLSIHILKVSENNFSTKVNEKKVRNDVDIANKIWKQANIIWNLKEINYVNPNLKNFKKNIQWIQNNCSSNDYSCIGRLIKVSKYEKLISIYNKLIKIKTTRNKKAINVYYLPKMLSAIGTGNNQTIARCAMHFPSFNKLKANKFNNEDYIIIGSYPNNKYCSLMLAHELGHVLGIDGHVNKGNSLMNGSGSFGYELDLNEINLTRGYYKKYFKILD